MYIRDTIRLVPWTTIKSVLAIDAKVLSTKPDRFVQMNLDTYDIAINTWMISLKDFAPYTWPSVLQYITMHGLCGAVEYFKSNASVFIADGAMPQGMEALAQCLYHEICRHFTARSLLTVDYATVDSPDAIFLFLCRFLKRMTPQYADILESKTVSQFWDNQKRIKGICRGGFNELILQRIRRQVNNATSRKIVKQRINKFKKIRLCDVEFSSGTCYSMSGKKLTSLSEKQRTLSEEVGYNNLAYRQRNVWDFYDIWDTPSHAYLMTVPKTISTARTIAPEECFRQSVARRMFTLCADNTYDGINLRNQGVNQEMACRGSLSDEWATIDLSHASDDVSWSLINEIYLDFPEYVAFLEKIRPQYLYSNGQSRLLHSFATMGNSMTFLVESEVFWLIARAAVHFAMCCGESTNDSVYVYGDDIVCHKNAYPYVVAFLEKLGFQVNTDKSYASGPYRESCGKEYINGIDVTGPYFPRSPLKSLLNFTRTGMEGRCVTTYQSLVSLQQRLFQVSPAAAQYVEFYLRESVARPLGTKVIGTQDEVMWGYADIPSQEVCRLTPYGTVTHLDNPWHFSKVDNRWKYNREGYIYVGATFRDLEPTPLYWRSEVTVSKGDCDPELIYCQYLESGPYYATDFDRLLGVSTSRFNIPTGKPTSKWVLRP